jgi:uncharacterized protein (DUF3084 family)
MTLHEAQYEEYLRKNYLRKMAGKMKSLERELATRDQGIATSDQEIAKRDREIAKRDLQIAARHHSRETSRTSSRPLSAHPLHQSFQEYDNSYPSRRELYDRTQYRIPGQDQIISQEETTIKNLIVKSPIIEDPIFKSH